MKQVQQALRHGRGRTLCFSAAVAATALLTACGGSPSSTGSGGASNAGGSATSQMLAFTHCMRIHGVPNFPDPTSDGKLPDFSAQQLGLSDSQLHADEGPCLHLLPNSSAETPAELQQQQNQALEFARCMRSHGMPNWPDPTKDSQGRPGFFNLPTVGIDLNSPQVRAEVQECTSLQHLRDAPRGAQLR